MINWLWNLLTSPTRTITPYSYGYRFGACPGDCCNKLELSGSDDIGSVGTYRKVGEDSFVHSSGYKIVRKTEPGFQGWLIENKFQTVIYAGESDTGKCPEETFVWRKINRIQSSRSSTIQNALKIKCAGREEASWTEWSRWTECQCRFGGKHRERTCQNGKSSEDCDGPEIEVEPCPTLKCSSCCGEVDWKLYTVWARHLSRGSWIRWYRIYSLKIESYWLTNDIGRLNTQFCHTLN